VWEWHQWEHGNHLFITMTWGVRKISHRLCQQLDHSLCKASLEKVKLFMVFVWLDWQNVLWWWPIALKYITCMWKTFEIVFFGQVVSLPTRIDPLQTSAVVSLHGRLHVRVPFEHGSAWLSFLCESEID
jgi:hypothetical protein